MKFHIYGTPLEKKNLVELPKSATIQDLRSLAHFNRIIRNYMLMMKLEKG